MTQKEQVEAAKIELHDLCHGKQFRMCIPHKDTDSDAVIGTALTVALTVLAENDRLRTAISEIPPTYEAVYSGMIYEICKYCENQRQRKAVDWEPPLTHTPDCLWEMNEKARAQGGDGCPK